MRFVVDECTGPAVAKWLREQGHDAFSVYEQARGLDDDRVLELAIRDQRILITNDKGFGERIFRERRLHAGVVLLRLTSDRAVNRVEAVRRLLAAHREELSGRFVVVTETAIRVASL